ncbi:MAG: SDR family oxidoreductase, partial [Methylococcales bacterium]
IIVLMKNYQRGYMMPLNKHKEIIIMDTKQKTFLKKIRAINTPIVQPTVQTDDVGIEYIALSSEGACCVLGAYGSWPMFGPFLLSPNELLFLMEDKDAYNIDKAFDHISNLKIVWNEIKEMFEGKKDVQQINVVLHSLAFGTLKPFISKDMSTRVTKAQMEMTLDVMAHSLVYWVQGLVERNLLANKARIFGLTSAGSQTIFPSYGAVSAAKASLESHIRQLAAELGVMGVTANSIMAGVTDTPALRKIPGNDKMMEAAKAKNPGGRLTLAMDVANTIVMLMDEKADWISGNVLQVDGGEYIVNYTGEKIARPIK